jgi:hypothetical protein
MGRTAPVILLASLLVLAALASAVRAVAPRGVLTAVEYRALGRELAALKSALGAGQPDWGAANAACRAVRTTPLLRAETADCEATVSEVHAVVATLSAVAGEPRCVAQPGRSSISCLLPAYQHLDTATHGALSADNAMYRVAAGRGFTGTCLYTLASTPAQRRDETQFARVMNETVAAMRADNRSELATLGPQLTRTMDAYLHANGPSNLAVCKHQ